MAISSSAGGSQDTSGAPSIARVRPASIRYMGFEADGDGRRYTLRVEGEGGPRVFVLLIPHTAFSEHKARFQDAPDLCYARLQRELARDAALLPREPLVLTTEDLAEYREQQTKRSSERKRKRPGTGSGPGAEPDRATQTEELGDHRRAIGPAQEARHTE